MESCEAEFVIEEREAEVLTGLLEGAGAADVEALEDEGFLPLAGVLVVAVIAVSALANVVMMVLRLWKTGVVVDARGSVVRTQKDAALPRGTVLVLTKAGTRHELSEPSALDIASLLRAEG